MCDLVDEFGTDLIAEVEDKVDGDNDPANEWGLWLLRLNYSIHKKMKVKIYLLVLKDKS